MRRPPPATVLGWLSFILIGWSGLLVPSVIRSVEADFAQTDAGLGAFYFLYAACYIVGSVGGGWLTERLGRRPVLAVAALLQAGGLVAQGLGPTWTVFLAAALPRGIGSGAIDGGVNGLFLDLYPASRGRALNVLHVFFSLGALGAPLAAGILLAQGLTWQVLALASGLVSLPLAALYAIVPMPSGRHAGVAPSAGRPGAGRLLSPTLVALAVAIGCYVASEIGVSNWLVRFLEPAPLSVATFALALFWGGLTLGRLVSAPIADRFDHVRFATAWTLAGSFLLVGAVLIPSVPLAVAVFGLVGVAFGPIFPLIVAIGGERYPGRSAAVGGFLSGAAVLGSVVYPPVMGLLSVTIGLTAAMLGTALLGFVGAGALLVAGRSAPERRLASDDARAGPV